MNVECVTLDEVLAAGAVRGASLVPESSGYLALAISDAISRLPLRVDSSAVAITTEGAVTVTRQGEVLPARDAARHMREILRRLLSVSTGSMPGLVATASPRPESDRGIDAFVAELEAALVPVNRSAGRRVLARLARETARARQAGRLKLALQVPAKIAPAPAPEPPVPVQVAPAPVPAPEPPVPVQVAPAPVPAPEPPVPIQVAPAPVPEPEPCLVSTDVDAPIELAADAGAVEPPADSATDVDAPVEFAFREAPVAELREATPTAPELPCVAEQTPAGGEVADPQDGPDQSCFSGSDPDCMLEELPTELVTDDLAPLLDGITTPAELSRMAVEVAKADPPAQFTPMDVEVQFTPAGPPAQLTPMVMAIQLMPMAPAIQFTPSGPPAQLSPIAPAVQFTPAGPPAHFTPVDAPASATPAAPPSHEPVDSFAHLTPTGTTLPWPVGLGMSPSGVHHEARDVAASPEHDDASGPRSAEPELSLDAPEVLELVAEPEPSLDAPEVLELVAEPEPNLVDSRAEPEPECPDLGSAERCADAAPCADADQAPAPAASEPSASLPAPAEPPPERPAPEPCAAQADPAPAVVSRVDELLASFAASADTDFRATAAGLKRLAGIDATLTPPPTAAYAMFHRPSEEHGSLPAPPASAPRVPAAADVPASHVPVPPKPRRLAAALKFLFAFMVAALSGAVIIWQVDSLLAPAPPPKAADTLPGASRGAPCPQGAPCPVLAGTP